MDNLKYRYNRRKQRSIRPITPLNNCIILISFSVTLIQKSELAQKGKKLSPDTTQEEMKVQKLMTGKTQNQKFTINRTDGDSFSKYKIQRNRYLCSWGLKTRRHFQLYIFTNVLVMKDYQIPNHVQSGNESKFRSKSVVPKNGLK